MISSSCVMRLFNIYYIRSFCRFAHCWRTPTPMIHLCLKLHTCTRPIGPSTKLQLAAGHRSMPWVDDHARLSCSKLQRYHNLCKRVKDILNEFECFLLLLVELNAGKGPSSHLWIFLCMELLDLRFENL